MKEIDYEVVIPIYNEGNSVIKVLNLFNKYVRYNIKVLLCYDLVDDNIFKYKNKFKKFKFKILLVKNNQAGPCFAVKKGFTKIKSKCVIVYPADDFKNFILLDKMYELYLTGAEIVVPSRFIKGGSMKNCPLLKSIIVKFASSTLFHFSSIPVKDASNGFRLFSKKILNLIHIESKVGFAYSLELLVKCHRLGMKIIEIPSKWEERTRGQSRFKVLNWLPQYLRWYIYGLQTSWFGKKKL